MRRDIDEALQGWPFDPEPGETQAREVRARDGRTVIQVRQELGLIQMEIEGRPDGLKPHGFQTYLEYLQQRAKRGGKGDGWVMPPEHHAEIDREFVQFYHRRIAWLALQQFDRMLRDADHTLALMDFVRDHDPDEEYVAAHERFRGIVLFHRTQAAAALGLERHRPDEAIEAVRDGIERLGRHEEDWSGGSGDENLPNAALQEQLQGLEQEIRRNFGVGKTLQEQLDEAVATEDYERAARLRDRLRGRKAR